MRAALAKKLQEKHNVEYRIILPADPTKCDNAREIQNAKIRDWVIPGEKILIFVETKNCLNAPDTFSFYCTVVDAEHVDSLSSISDELLPSSLSTKKSIPDLPQYFSSPNGIFYFPIRVTVPRSRSSSFNICLLLPHQADPISQMQCASLNPFSIKWHPIVASQSTILQFLIETTLPSSTQIFHLPDIYPTGLSLHFDERVSSMDYHKSIAIIETSRISFPVEVVSNGDLFSIAFTLKPLSNAGAKLISYAPLSLTLTWTADDVEYFTEYHFISTFQLPPPNKSIDQYSEFLSKQLENFLGFKDQSGSEITIDSASNSVRTSRANSNKFLNHDDYFHQTMVLSAQNHQAEWIIQAPVITCEKLKLTKIPIRIIRTSDLPGRIQILFDRGDIEPSCRKIDLDVNGNDFALYQFGFLPLKTGYINLPLVAIYNEKILQPLSSIVVIVK